MVFFPRGQSTTHAYSYTSSFMLVSSILFRLSVKIRGKFLAGLKSPVTAYGSLWYVDREAAQKDNALPLNAPVAQLDRVSGYEPEGREFESLRARHFSRNPMFCGVFFSSKIRR